MKVLIVEDDTATALVVKKMVEKNHFTVTGMVKKGKDAIAAAEADTPNIIIMDIFLEGEMDGVQTAELLNEKYNLPVIFISSYADYQAILQSKLNHPFSFLLKPINEKELESSLQITLYRHEIDTLLKSSERQFRMLADFSPDIITLFDINKKKFLYINKSELFGYTKEDFQKVKLSALFYEEDYRRLKTYWRKVLSSYGKQPPSIEVRIKCKNTAKWEWINLRQSIIEHDVHSRKTLLLTVISYITEKKNAELELLKTNYELDNFIYRASHDLSAPLKSIMGLVNLIRMEADPEKKIKYLDLIQISANRMDNYIYDMTNYARNNRMEIENELVDFEHLYQTQLNSLKEKEGFDKVQKIFSLNQSSDFFSDSLRISILLNSLLSNAIKFQNTSRTDAYVKVSIAADQSVALISVSDNGIGIRPDFLERIFDMFYRASENANGSGLGLYIAKQITGKLGGTIDIESQYGMGTTLNISIPNQIKFISRY